jgi:hypothetical protein
MYDKYVSLSTLHCITNMFNHGQYITKDFVLPSSCATDGAHVYGSDGAYMPGDGGAGGWN